MPGDGKRRDRIGALLVGRARGRRLRCATSGASAPASPRPSSIAWPRCCARSSARTRRSRPAARRSRAARCSPSRELVAEVEFREWTDGGQLRAPSYKGLRDDKPAELVVREEANADPGRGRRAPGEALEPRQGPLSRGRLRQARRHRLLRAHRAGRPAAPRGPRADAQALPQRRRRRSSSTRRTRRRTAPSGCTTARVGVDRLRRRRRRGDARLAGQPRRPRAAHLAGAGRRPRAPDARRLRPRSRPAGDDRRVLPRRASCCAACSRASACECFAKTSGSKGMQVYLPLNTRRRPSRRPRPSPRRSPSCSRARSPGSSSRARPSPRARARCSSTGARTTSTRRRSTSTRCARWPRPTVSTPVTWDEVARGAARPRTSPSRPPTSCARVDEHGDLFAPVLTLVQRLPGA